MNLSNYAGSKNNNFNLIRMIAASAVLFTHSFSLATGVTSNEPTLSSSGEMTAGAIAVDVFFVTSGFLVTASLLSRQSIIDFIVARTLRILPALIVVLLLTLLVLGPLFTTIPIRDYATHPSTFSYFWLCSTLVFQIPYLLPGVFESNPYQGVINGSLWSMKYEVRLYALLAGLWLFASLGGNSRSYIFRLMIISFAAVLCGATIAQVIVDEPVSTGLRLACFFFSGAAYNVLADHIPLSARTCWGIIGILILWGLFRIEFHAAAYYICLPYILFFLAYVPSGIVRNYNLLGDYSYGVYIYAFPVQQSIVALAPGVTPTEITLVAFPVTFAFAWLSWHLIESRALEKKNATATRVRTLLRK